MEVGILRLSGVVYLVDEGGFAVLVVD